MPFAESPWEIELSFGCGWQIESVGICRHVRLRHTNASAQAVGRFPGMGKHFFRGTLYFRDSYQLNSTLSRGQETHRLVRNPELNL